MPGNTFHEIVELRKAFKEDREEMGSPFEKVSVEEKSVIKKEYSKTEHGEGSCEHDANKSIAPQHQHQVCSLNNVKIEKTEPFFHEEKYNEDFCKYKNDGRSVSSDLYRISLFNLIKLEPHAEPQSAEPKNTQDRDCKTGGSALQCKNVRNKRKRGNWKNKTKKTKQGVSSSTQKHQSDLVTNMTKGIEVPCAKNATYEVAATNKTINTPAFSGPKNAQITIDMPTPENNHISKSTGSDKARSLSVSTQACIKYKMKSITADMSASDNNYVTFNSLVSDNTKSVTANKQNNNKSEMQPNLLDTYAGEEQHVAHSSEMPMPFTDNQETNANSFEGKCKIEKQEDKKCISLVQWSCDQRRRKQRTTGFNHGPWQRMNRPSHPHKFHTFWRRAQQYRKLKQNERNLQFQGSVWQSQVHGWQNQESLQKNERCMMKNPGSVWYSRGNGWSNQGNCFHNQESGWLSQGNIWHRQGNSWPSQGNSWHNQGNSWPSQGNSWHNQGNCLHNQGNCLHNQGNYWHSQGNGWHNQENGWYNQRNELQSQGCGFNDQGSRNQNIGNGWRNLRSNIQSQGQENKQSSWQSQAYQNQNRIWQNQSSSFLNHTCRIQNSMFLQHKHNSKILDNKSSETEHNLSIKQELLDRQVKEKVSCLNKMEIKCSTFTEQTGDVKYRENGRKADPQDESGDIIECKMIDEINGKNSPENAVVAQVQHTRKKWDQSNKDNEAEVQFHDNRHLNCSKSDTVKIEQDIIYIPHEGSLNSEQTAGCSIYNSSSGIADEYVKKAESSENSEKCFAKSGIACGDDDDDDECIITNTSQHLHSSWSDGILDKPGSPTGSRKCSNLEKEIKIVWENVNNSNISDSLLIDIT